MQRGDERRHLVFGHVLQLVHEKSHDGSALPRRIADGLEQGDEVGFDPSSTVGGLSGGRNPCFSREFRYLGPFETQNLVPRFVLID
jgi:hypothetical protein